MAYGKAFWTAIGTFVTGLGSVLPDPYNKVAVVIGAIIVFAAQKLFEAGFIPESRRR